MADLVDSQYVLDAGTRYVERVAGLYDGEKMVLSISLADLKSFANECQDCTDATHISFMLAVDVDDNTSEEQQTIILYPSTETGEVCKYLAQPDKVGIERFNTNFLTIDEIVNNPQADPVPDVIATLGF